MSTDPCVTVRVSNGLRWCHTHEEFLPHPGESCSAGPMRTALPPTDRDGDRPQTGPSASLSDHDTQHRGRTDAR